MNIFDKTSHKQIWCCIQTHISRTWHIFLRVRVIHIALNFKRYLHTWLMYRFFFFHQAVISSLCNFYNYTYQHNHETVIRKNVDIVNNKTIKVTLIKRKWKMKCLFVLNFQCLPHREWGDTKYFFQLSKFSNGSNSASTQVTCLVINKSMKKAQFS
jgi:hypothetical protein